MREHFNRRELRPPPPDDRHGQKSHQGEPGFDRPPPPRTGPRRARIPPVFLLKDAQSRLIIGPSRDQANAYWIPVKLEEQTVGYFGFIRHSNIDGNLDRLFAERVQKYLAWLLLGMLVITGLIAVPLAARFVKPIEKLSEALRELAHGNFGVRLEQQGRDEIADLQGDFNRLAETMARNLESRQRWIADISHELRTPVAVLRGEIEAILDGVRQPDQVYIKSLHQEIMRMTQLIDDLYQLSLSD
ncbi:MAG: HAMP domain-containing protein, partial [bacterium]|nr:HAMP domain-containing protein [bacterium]